MIRFLSEKFVRLVSSSLKMYDLVPSKTFNLFKLASVRDQNIMFIDGKWSILDLWSKQKEETTRSVLS
jgi:hypothetical protein